MAMEWLRSVQMEDDGDGGALRHVQGEKCPWSGSFYNVVQSSFCVYISLSVF